MALRSADQVTKDPGPAPTKGRSYGERVEVRFFGEFEVVERGEVVRERFIGIGLGAEFADAYMALLAETVDRPALVTHDAEKILDRPARTFAQWVSEHRNLFTNS